MSDQRPPAGDPHHRTDRDARRGLRDAVADAARSDLGGGVGSDARRRPTGDVAREPGGDQADRLARLIDDLARAQPPRRAPASLEARVLAHIAAEPWWRKGFAHWPIPARVAFLVASFGFIKVALAGVMWAFDFAQTTHVTGLHQTTEAVSATVSLSSLVLDAIPTVWLYAGAAVGCTLYAVLFGLGTFAYRTLYLQR